VTAAITGGAIMIVEILGAKMLAPYVGTSHFVWTAQIAVTLVALAAGYYAGGLLVDRSSKLSLLYGGILVAAFYLGLTVLIVRPVAYWCLEFKLAWGTLLASTFLFFVPLSLLAMVGPFLIRVLTVSISGVGGNVGRLTAISTLGSFAGTVLIGYLLIPYSPNSTTMLLTAGVLMVIGANYFWIWGRSARQKVGTVLMVLLALGAGWLGLDRERFRAEKVVELYRGNSNFGLLQVLQRTDRPVRYYLNDYLTQNMYDTNEHKSVNMFTYMLHDLARAYTPRIENVLCIGLGIGIVPRTFASEGARVEVVEINPAIVPVAQKYFELKPEQLDIFIGDGRHFLNRCPRQYDAVILDAFLGDSCPSHLMTREAFTAMRRVLKPRGVLVINTFADLEAGQDFFAASLSKTLATVFASVRIHKGINGNTLFVASHQPELAILNPPDFTAVHSDCLRQVKEAFAGICETHPDHGRVLTDNFNPVEYFDAANRERLRRDLAQNMREL
jgi:predicted membrane-bound spermidine synthase